MKKRIIYILISLVIIGLGVGGWFYFNRAKPPVYESVIIQPTTLVQEVSVTGNVKPRRELNLSLKRIGRVTNLPVVVGQTVSAGALLLELDTGDEKRAVEEAMVALASAKLALDKLLKPVNRQATEDKLKQAYEDGLATAASTYANLYSILDRLDKILFGSELASSADDENIDYYVGVIDFYNPKFKTVPAAVRGAYDKIIKAYDPAFADYQAARRGGDNTVTERAILATYDLVGATINVLKTSRDVIQFFKDKSIADSWTANKQTTIDSHLTSLAADATTVDNYWLDLVETVNTIKTEHSTIDVSDLDLESARLEIKQKESALAEVKARLADSYLYAPLAAIVTKIEPEVGELVTANSPVMSLISSGQLLLETNVPEADIAKIKLNDSARVTLDAYGDDLIFDAQVSAIDPAATLIDGVATYRTTLHFLEFDDRIKSGLTAEINISTAKREGVLAVPERAVTAWDGVKIVRILKGGSVMEQIVQTGLRGSDGRVEIVSGLESGAEVIVFSQD